MNKSNKMSTNFVRNELSKFYSLKGSKDKILLVGHDCDYGGAQILLKNMIKEFKNKNVNVVLFVKKEGPLLETYKKIAPVFIIDNKEKIEFYIMELSKCGYQGAILNTILSGNLIPILKKYDFYTVSLVHELPYVIKLLNAESFVEIIAKSADLVVFPSLYVANKFETFFKVRGKKLIQTQGLYNVYDNFNEKESRQKLEIKYNIPPENYIILNVGLGEKRKGFDLFYEISDKLKNDKFTFIWVGDINDEMKQKYPTDIKNDNLILPGYIADSDEIMDFYGACDVFMLTSREDPFPSVVLEAFNAKKPVIGFENAGGFQDIVINNVSGFLVEYESTDKLIDKLKYLCNNEQLRKTLGNNGSEICEKYNFSEYIDILKDYCDKGILKINYNSELLSLENEIKIKNNIIISLKRKNKENNKLIADLKIKNRKLNKHKRELLKFKKDILSSSSWTITDPLRKLKYYTKKALKIDTKTKNSNNEDIDIDFKENIIEKVRYIYSIKNNTLPLIQSSFYKMYITAIDYKRINIFFDRIDENIYEFEALFSFLIKYCNQYSYSMRIIYHHGNLQILKDFLKNNKLSLPPISYLYLKENYYLEIGLNEKYVCTSLKNAKYLINSNIHSVIYFYLHDLDEYTEEEQIQFSKICYNENVIILNDNWDKLDKLKKFNYHYDFNINQKDFNEKTLCFDFTELTSEGMELLDYLFLNNLFSNWKVHLISNCDLSDVLINSKQLFKPISKKSNSYDIFLKLMLKNKNIKLNNENYIKIYFEEEADNNYNLINIFNDDEIYSFNTFSLQNSNKKRFNPLDEIFNKLNEVE